MPFTGGIKLGIATPPAARLSFASFDLLPGARRDDLAGLLRRWSVAAERMTRGLSPEAEAHRPAQPPLDSGEALGVPPCRLTVTFGLGPDVFHPRLGLAAARPRRLEPLPAMPGDALSAARCGGDLMIQACAEDAMVSYHAIRHLVRLASGTARVRWLQQGFGATATTTPAPLDPAEALRAQGRHRQSHHR
ncbi:MAG: Dyp-type peroxidase domain-containing protein [Mycobacteriales bacterium]